MFADKEAVLVIPTAQIKGLTASASFHRDKQKAVYDVLNSPYLRFMPRAAAETDETYKQIIPYMLLRGRSNAGAIAYYTYVRGNTQGEARLHSKLSFGIGGHISESDSDTIKHAFYSGANRELMEEIKTTTSLDIADFNALGAVYDNSTPVGRVHYGIVLVADVDMASIANNDSAHDDARFMFYPELRQHYSRLENWSRIIFNSLRFTKDK